MTPAFFGLLLVICSEPHGYSAQRIYGDSRRVERWFAAFAENTDDNGFIRKNKSNPLAKCMKICYNISINPSIRRQASNETIDKPTGILSERAPDNRNNDPVNPIV